MNYSIVLKSISKLLDSLFDKYFIRILIINEVNDHSLFTFNTTFFANLPQVFICEKKIKEIDENLSLTSLFGLLKKSGEASVLSSSELKKYWEACSAPSNSQVGSLKHNFAGLIKSHDEPLGIIFLSCHCSNDQEEFNKVYIERIVDLYTCTFINILETQKTNIIETEKALLLSLSEDMATARNKDDLFKVIWEKIKPIIGFEDAVASLYSENLKLYKHFVTASGPERRAHPLYKEIVNVFFPIADSPDEYVLQQIIENDILRWDTEDILTAFPNHFIGSFLKENNLHCNIYQKLSWGGKIIGFLNFHFNSPDKIDINKYHLYKAIASQIAVAMSNIVANEEIEEREAEKTILLSISDEIAQIRDLRNLVEWLSKKSLSLVESNYISVNLVKKEDRSVQFIWGEKDASWQLAVTGRARKGLIDSGITYEGSFFDYIDTLPEGSIFKIENIDQNLPGYPMEWLSRLKISESFVIKLRNKGDCIGQLIFHRSHGSFEGRTNILLLQNVANQIAVALLNILANEEANEREIKKRLEIEINNAVLANQHFPEVLKGIAESLNGAMSCDMCYIRIQSENIDIRPFNLFCEKKDDVFVVKKNDEVLKYIGISPLNIEQYAANFLTPIQKAFVLTGEAFDAKCLEHEYLDTFKKRMQIRSFIFIPIFLKEQALAHLIIASKRPYAYIEKDLDLINSIITQLSLTLDNRLAFLQIQKLKEMLETENLYLQEEIKVNLNFDEMVGVSDEIKQVFEAATIVAETDTTVLIGGETGTGKELIARAIHNISPRREKLMIKVNCACLPAQLVESELFGHEKGAFTGAYDRRIGKFELANGGTIFLDEIGELPLELQAKLLRVIQEREFERIGGKTTIKTNIRIIAATNKDLAKESAEKRFRTDLYYRLNVYPINLPPLRERKSDIPLLAMHFVKKFAGKMGKSISGIETEALKEMTAYDWPGNIRELEHTIEHSVICCRSVKLSLARPLLLKSTPLPGMQSRFKLITLDENEREHILSILRYTGGRIRGTGGAAQLLNIHPNTLESRMQKLGIKKEHKIV